MIQHDLVREFLLLYYAHAFHMHTRGTWTAFECVDMDRDGAEHLPYCAPAQLTIPILTKWMLVFEDSLAFEVWLAKAVPRRWLADGCRVRVTESRQNALGTNHLRDPLGNRLGCHRNNGRPSKKARRTRDPAPQGAERKADPLCRSRWTFLGTLQPGRRVCNPPPGALRLSSGYRALLTVAKLRPTLHESVSRMSSGSCDHIASVRDPLPAVPVTHHANFSLRLVAYKPDNYGGRKRGEHRKRVRGTLLRGVVAPPRMPHTCLVVGMVAYHESAGQIIVLERPTNAPLPPPTRLLSQIALARSNGFPGYVA